MEGHGPSWPSAMEGHALSWPRPEPRPQRRTRQSASLQGKGRSAHRDGRDGARPSTGKANGGPRSLVAVPHGGPCSVMAASPNHDPKHGRDGARPSMKKPNGGPWLVGKCFLIKGTPLHRTPGPRTRLAHPPRKPSLAEIPWNSNPLGTEKISHYPALLRLAHDLRTIFSKAKLDCQRENFENLLSCKVHPTPQSNKEAQVLLN